MLVLKYQLRIEKKKTKSNFNFQFPTKRKLKIKYRISIFNLQEKQTSNLIPILSIHGRDKMKFGCQFLYFNFSIAATSFYFQSAVLPSDQSEKARNEQRPESNENHSHLRSHFFLGHRPPSH